MIIIILNHNVLALELPDRAHLLDLQIRSHIVYFVNLVSVRFCIQIISLMLKLNRVDLIHLTDEI